MAEVPRLTVINSDCVIQLLLRALYMLRSLRENVMFLVIAYRVYGVC